MLRERRVPLVLPEGSTRYACDYHRQGVAQRYRLHEPLAERRRVQVEAGHDRLPFARVVAQLLDHDYAQAERVTVVLATLSAHQPAAFYEVFEPARAHALWQRVEFVFTPKHGSWPHMAEIEFAALLPTGYLGECLSAQPWQRITRLGNWPATNVARSLPGSS